MPEVTYTTLLPTTPDQDRFLSLTARLMCRAARQFYVDWQKNFESPDELIKSYQPRFGLTWHQANSIHRFVKGVVTSALECRKRHIANLEGQIKSAVDTIKKWEKIVKDNGSRARRKRKPIIPPQRSQQELRSLIHYKKRRVAFLEAKLKQLKTKPPHILWGGKKLFKSQFYLDANGYSSYYEWKEDWDNRRHSQFFLVGKASDRCGNRSAQWHEDGLLRICVPPVLREEFGDFVEIASLYFPYGTDDLIAALKGKKPLTHRFVRKDNKWYLHTTVEINASPIKNNYSVGMMGIDLNPNEVGWTVTNNHGNPIATGSIPYDLFGKSSKQSTHIVSLIVRSLVEIARQYEVNICVEKLDFTEKKRTLREKGQGYSRMLSFFAYSKFDQLLVSRCHREGVKLLQRNPAWSSLIGMTKFMKRYGMSSATAAALVMARRGQRFSERLPARYARLLQVDGKRHVWNHWGMFKKKLVKKLPRHSFFCLDTAIQEHVALLEVDSSAEKPRKNSASSVP